MSGDDETEDGAVEDEAFDDVEENECVELPDVDLDEPDGVEAADGNENSDEPYRDDGRRGLLDMNGFEGRCGVDGAVGTGGLSTVNTACSSDDDGVSSRR